MKLVRALPRIAAPDRCWGGPGRWYCCSHPMITLRPAIALLAVLLAAPAWADDVEVRTDDGHVIATVTVDASMAEVRALLGNPVKLAESEGRGAEVSPSEVDGCIQSDIVSHTGVGDVTYTVRSCPKADGFEGSLVSSEKIRDLQARWTLTEAGGRVTMTYDLYFVPRVRVPQRLVATLAQRGVRRLLEAVRDEVES